MKKKNDTENKKIDSEKKMISGSNYKCKSCYAIIAITLVILCAIFEHLFNKHKYSEFSESSKKETLCTIEESMKNYEVKISELKEEIGLLKNEISNIKDAHVTQKQTDVREKWKAWLSLKNKIEEKEAFDDELENFNKVFAYDKELISLLEEFTNEVSVVSDESSGDSNVVDVCKKYLRKVVNLKKVDRKKIFEISGYVLSSIENSD